MYSNQSLYYLEQIGITPWVTRKNVAPMVLALIPIMLTDTAKQLCHEMLLYLNLEEKLLVIKEIDTLHSEINLLPSIITIVFGEKLVDLLSKSSEQPLIIVSDLDYILQNPLKKRDVFTQLNRIKQVIDNE